MMRKVVLLSAFTDSAKDDKEFSGALGARQTSLSSSLNRSVVLRAAVFSFLSKMPLCTPYAMHSATDVFVPLNSIFAPA